MNNLGKILIKRLTLVLLISANICVKNVLLTVLWVSSRPESVPVERLRHGLEHIGPRTFDEKRLVRPGVTEEQARIVELDDAYAPRRIVCGVVFLRHSLALASPLLL